MTTSHMPPGQISLLLHYHFSPAEPDRNNMTREWTDHFLSNDLIERREDGMGYTTTERGRAFVEMLCNTPLPISKWVDPRVEPVEPMLIKWKL